MSMKKIMTLIGMFLLLTAGLTFAGQNFQSRPLFIDENGDGICDLLRDSDMDGIPNCQDPDRLGPQDGTGKQNRFGNANNGFRNGGGQGNQWNRNSFRNQGGQLGKGMGNGNGNGLKGNGYRGGKK